jgi:glutathione S-transferase
MAEVILYGSIMSPFVRPVALALQEKGVAHRLEEVEQGSPAHRALHPWARVPVLRHGEVVLFESAAIAHYVDEAFPGPALRPADALGRARVLQWISAAQDYFYKHVVAAHLFHYFMQQWRGTPLDPAVIEAGLPALRSTVGIVEKALAGRDWLVGDQLTLADLFLGPMAGYLGLSPASAELLQQSPNLRAYTARLAARASFQATQPPPPPSA